MAFNILKVDLGGDKMDWVGVEQVDARRVWWLLRLGGSLPSYLLLRLMLRARVAGV